MTTLHVKSVERHQLSLGCASPLDLPRVELKCVVNEPLTKLMDS